MNPGQGERKSYKVKEKVWTPYLMAKLKGSLGSSDLTGNIGVQAVHTDQTSSGLVYPTDGSPAQQTSLGISIGTFYPVSTWL